MILENANREIALYKIEVTKMCNSHYNTATSASSTSSCGRRKWIIFFTDRSPYRRNKWVFCSITIFNQTNGQVKISQRWKQFFFFFFFFFTWQMLLKPGYDVTPTVPSIVHYILKFSSIWFLICCKTFYLSTGYKYLAFL